MRWQVKESVYKKLIRTDKHGNKIYRTNACKRCGGCGKVWFSGFLGSVCFECEGRGIVPEYKTTEYTPAQQRLRAAKREAKKLGTIEQQIKQNGVNPETLESFWLYGDTYKHRDEIRELGGVWMFRTWQCPVPFVADGITTRRITYKVIEEEVEGFKYRRLMVETDSFG
jgi:hypothetical protein